MSQKSTILNVYMNSQTYQVSITLSAANETYLLGIEYIQFFLLFVLLFYCLNSSEINSNLRFSISRWNF